MDAARKAYDYSRKLTKTEIALASAQIADRLMRVCTAAEISYKFAESITGGDHYEEKLAEKIALLRLRFEIPKAVWFCGEEHANCDDIKPFIPFISYWVAGTLLEAEAFGMQFYFESWREIDYSWAFMDAPMNYYGIDPDSERPEEDKMIAEWLKIGTRDIIKHRGKKLWECIFDCPIISEGLKKLDLNSARSEMDKMGIL